MPSRNVYHVVPHDDQWAVRLEGADAVSAVADDQEEAVQQAATFIRTLGAGRVVVHGDGGKIQTVHTFEQLPAEPSGVHPFLTSGVLLAAAAIGLVAVGYGLSRRR